LFNQQKLNSIQPRSAALYARAAAVIPGGIPGHQSPALSVPGVSPYFAERAEGAIYWDVDGRRLIDFMGGFGPLVLGARHMEVDAAFNEVQMRGMCFNHPTATTVELAERLVELVDFSDWAFFGKNGADMTYWTVRVAREHRQRRKVIKVKTAYHGTEPWCSDSLAGVLAEDKTHIIEIGWNDAEALEAVVAAHADDIAGIIMTPFDHPTYGDMTLPSEIFLARIDALRNETGMVWVLDDVRAGFRHDLGGSHRYFGFTPDLSCFSKAIANGYALSACVGGEALRPAASRVFATGSFWNNPGPMAAALKTLEILERDACIPTMLRRGSEWIERFLALGEKNGIRFIASGTPTMPFIRIADDGNFHRQQAFCCEAIQAGVFLHPHHNWFIGNAHSDEVLDDSLKLVERAMKSFLDCTAQSTGE
jgi:glutamate-1-semialdehyde 2,1-aminomutase